MRSLQVELLYPKVSLVEHKEAKQLNFECLHHEESVVEQKLEEAMKDSDSDSYYSDAESSDESNG